MIWWFTAYHFAYLYLCIPEQPESIFFNSTRFLLMHFASQKLICYYVRFLTARFF